MNIIITFKNTEDADRVDLTRLGTILGSSREGRIVKVELDLLADALDGDEGSTMRPTGVSILIRDTLAACSVWVEIETEEVN